MGKKKLTGGKASKSLPFTSYAKTSVHSAIKNAADIQNSLNNGILGKSMTSTIGASNTFNWCNPLKNGITYPSFSNSNSSPSNATTMSGNSNQTRTQSITNAEYDTGQKTLPLKGGKGRCNICGEKCNCKKKCKCKKYKHSKTCRKSIKHKKHTSRYRNKHTSILKRRRRSKQNRLTRKNKI